MGSDYQCTQIKDRNGNFITVNYTSFGSIDNIVDTLGRTVEFNYDAGNYLSSITQTWTVSGVAQTHTWASFAYTNTTIQTNFTGLTNLGPPNGSTVKMLTRVTLDDGSRFDFDYTSWGQIWKIRNSAADGHLLNYRSYNLPLNNSTAQTDCPRFTQRRDWAENWNRSGALGQALLPSGAELEVITSYTVPVSSSWTLPNGTPQTGMRALVTQPDGTYNKIYFAGAVGTSSGWQRGLRSLVETYDSANVRQRQAATSWTQDDTAVSYQLNPRVTETNIYDPAGNRARTRVTYQSASFANGTSCQLPQDVYEYQADAATVMRRSHTTYNLATTYTNRRIIGLVSEQTLYEVDPDTQAETLMSKVGFTYDGSGSIQGTAAPVQHDNTNYGASFVAGRANLSSVKRYNVLNTTFVTSSSKYNTTGATVSTTDPLNHQVTIAYADSFSDGINNRNALAYPTTVTDADGFSSLSQYNFDFGAVTRTQSPPPAGQTVGAIKNFTYDPVARIQQVTIEFSGDADYSHTRFVYPASQNRVDTYTTIQEGQAEGHSFNISDGHGRLIATAKDHPRSVGGFSGQLTLYNNMGQVVKQSNPTETTAVGIPAQWPDAGDDAQAGWLYTQQTYDWKGRPLVKTNTDLTTKQAIYAGCGCAGGQVVTLTDEGTLVNGATKKRQQKIYADALGRTWKTELLNWDGAGPFGTGGSVYSATVNTYNARDQLTLVREFQGVAPTNPNDLSCPTGACQQTTTTYDGHGRLKTRHVPEQDAGASTTYDYFNDDTVQKMTDARGATATYNYNARHLVTGITYGVPAGSTIPVPAAVSYAYDAAGNRTSMTDGMGSVGYAYDQLSRLASETRTFTGVGTFALNYDYNLAGELKSITDPAGATINYAFDLNGRITSVTGTTFGGVTQYASNMQYRAWGDVKALSYGNTRTQSASYNARLQSTHFEVPGVISKNYQYQSDGNVKYTADLLDNRFDRSYSYDHLSRISEALSGPAARGETDTTNRPYKQYYQYDAMNNLMGRVGSRLWSGPSGGSFGTDTYLNNRNTSWQYDADGRLLNSLSNEQEQAEQYTHDAAGRAITVVSESGDHTQTRSFDGDGLQTRMVDMHTTYDQFGTPTTTTTTSYNIPSTVLDAVVTELDQNGQKARTFVYSDGQVLAWQQKVGSTENVLWEYRDLSSASYRMAVANGLIDGSRSAELDPLGSDAGMQNRYGLPQHHWPQEDRTYPGFADLMSGDCTIDGIPAPCGLAMRMLTRGVGRQVIPGETDRNGDPLPDAPGQGTPPTLKPPSGSQRHSHDSNSAPSTDLFDDEGKFIGNLWMLLPQNPYDPRVDFRDYAEGLAKNKGISDCQKLALMIYKAGQVFGGSNPFSDSGSGTIHGLMAGLTEYTRVASGGREGPSNPNYRVGVFTRDPHYGGGFGDSGFGAAFQDGSNQVRHFTFYLGAGWGIGSTLANRGLYREEGTNDPRVADVGLGLAATDLGSRFNGNYKQLAQDVWHRVCGQSGDLKLP